MGVFTMQNLEQILENTTLVDSFRSRYGDKRDVYECNVEKGTFYLLGKSRYYRVGGDKNDVEYIDFEGGPFVMNNDVFLGEKRSFPKITDLAVVPLQTEGFFCVKFKANS